MKARSTAALAAGIGLVFVSIGGAQSRSDTLDMGQVLARQDAMIPMRDGVRLYTEIYTPRNRTAPLPIIMERTPYNARAGVTGFRPTATGYSTRLHDHEELVKSGYIFVFQDLRGRDRSEGAFVTTRPQRTDAHGTDESTDTYDTIDWLIKNLPGNNGRVGILGISYGGFTTMRAMLGPHPALKATSPQASCADMFVGDDWHHNGAFRLDYSFQWIAAMETAREHRTWSFDKTDAFEWFLDLGPLSQVNARYLHGEAPSWNAFVAHPNLDSFWERESCAVLPYITDVPVPTLSVAGWFDAEDFYGPLEIYQKLERFDRHGWNYLVVGPWVHGGWTIDEEGQKIGSIDFGSATSRYFRERIQAPWFAYWLKDEGKLGFPEVRAFQTGANVWESLDGWPPKIGTHDRSLYLRSDGRLSFDPPTEPNAADSYESDPSKPVPYRPRPIRGSEGWPAWQLEDQRLAHLRPDVLSWTSEPLREDLVVTGDIVAKLFASSTGTDSDWIVKLIDVFPDPNPSNPRMGGYQMMVAGEVFRARFRHGFRKPEPLVPGQPTPYSISLRDRNHRFSKGHRLMVQVQSTWFPVIDRNPQTFVPNIFEARAGDFRKATQRIYRSQSLPSHLVLPVRGAVE